MRVIFILPIYCVFLNIYANGDDCPEARCGDGKCIADSLVCNGKVDCLDKTDEKDCGSKQCSDTEFTCHYGACIPLNLDCNQKFDCLDGSDESFEQCTDHKPCPKGFFQCGYGGCIELNKKCDKKFDCPDQTDEYPPLCEPDIKHNLRVE